MVLMSWLTLRQISLSLGCGYDGLFMGVILKGIWRISVKFRDFLPYGRGWWGEGIAALREVKVRFVWVWIWLITGWGCVNGILCGICGWKSMIGAIGWLVFVSHRKMVVRWREFFSFWELVCWVYFDHKFYLQWNCYCCY